jgi:hypothetical protein
MRAVHMQQLSFYWMNFYKFHSVNFSLNLSTEFSLCQILDKCSRHWTGTEFVMGLKKLQKKS